MGNQYSEMTIYPPPQPDLRKYTDLFKCPPCGQSVCILLKIHFNILMYTYKVFG